MAILCFLDATDDLDDLNFFNQKKKKKKTKKIFDIDEAEEGVKVCLRNYAILSMAENFLTFVFLGLAVQELFQLSLCLSVVDNET